MKRVVAQDAQRSGLDRRRTLPLPASSATSDLQPKANDPIKAPVQLITAITQPATASCLARPVMLLLLSFSVGLASMRPCAATPFEWEYTGSLKDARFHHTATLLPDGRVLVVGGEHGHEPLASAELYDPATGTWSDTGSLNTERDSHTATLLPNGLVLVAGGIATEGGASLASAELYDPATGNWSPTGSLDTGRLLPHRNSPAQRHGAGRGRNQHRHLFSERGTL